MGKQYKALKAGDIAFIQEQKLFYVASVSCAEVNLSPKGYDSIRVVDSSTLLFMDYVGSGNRTYRDAKNEGKFTLVFNAFEGKAKILRLFCTAELIGNEHADFPKYVEQFHEKASLVRDFFLFHIDAVESSCGEAVPLMSYQAERPALKEWMLKMDANNKLEAYKQQHRVPPDHHALEQEETP
ncbi:MAG: pyridoxamine 5'-phosphate oxidase family protein [Sulfurimonas sp.]|nr:MAG: pyridoxamine 5'-phosphate oxidase family protein [Sulfurimonas sp.]